MNISSKNEVEQIIQFTKGEKMFNNKPNRCFKDESGRIQWVSRSTAVVAVVKCVDRFLVTKRGNKVSNTGKWCVPCGYIDWNESASDAVIREVYEETGIYLKDYEISGVEKPYDLVTDPGVNWRQDIAIHFCVTIHSDVLPEVDFSKLDSNETTDAKWISVDELSEYKFAFNHDKRILLCQ